MRSPKNPAPLIRVIPLEEWLAARNMSYWTFHRLRKAGKVKVTQTSPGRIGIREDHDQEFLNSCLVDAE